MLTINDVAHSSPNSFKSEFTPSAIWDHILLLQSDAFSYLKICKKLPCVALAVLFVNPGTIMGWNPSNLEFDVMAHTH